MKIKLLLNPNMMQKLLQTSLGSKEQPCLEDLSPLRNTAAAMPSTHTNPLT